MSQSSSSLRRNLCRYLPPSVEVLEDRCTPSNSGLYNALAHVHNENAMAHLTANCAKHMPTMQQPLNVMTTIEMTTTVGVPTPIMANASGGTAPYMYSFSLPDGTVWSGTSDTAMPTFSMPGDYLVLVSVTDAAGMMASTSTMVHVVV